RWEDIRQPRPPFRIMLHPSGARQSRKLHALTGGRGRPQQSLDPAVGLAPAPCRRGAGPADGGAVIQLHRPNAEIPFELDPRTDLDSVQDAGVQTFRDILRVAPDRDFRNVLRVAHSLFPFIVSPHAWSVIQARNATRSICPIASSTSRTPSSVTCRMTYRSGSTIGYAVGLFAGATYAAIP